MVPCISCVPSLAAFKSFSLPLFSISLLMLYFGLHFIGFNLFEDGQVCAIFWSFTNVQPLFFEYSFCLTLFSSLSSTPRIKILDLVLLSHRSLRLCSIFFFNLFFSLLIKPVNSISMPTSSLTILFYLHSTMSTFNMLLISAIAYFTCAISILFFFITFIPLLRN